MSKNRVLRLVHNCLNLNIIVIICMLMPSCAKKQQTDDINTLTIEDEKYYSDAQPGGVWRVENIVSDYKEVCPSDFNSRYWPILTFEYDSIYLAYESNSIRGKCIQVHDSIFVKFNKTNDFGNSEIGNALNAIVESIHSMTVYNDSIISLNTRNPECYIILIKYP